MICDQDHASMTSRFCPNCGRPSIVRAHDRIHAPFQDASWLLPRIRRVRKPLQLHEPVERLSIWARKGHPDRNIEILREAGINTIGELLRYASPGALYAKIGSGTAVHSIIALLGNRGFVLGYDTWGAS